MLYVAYSWEVADPDEIHQFGNASLIMDGQSLPKTMSCIEKIRETAFENAFGSADYRGSPPKGATVTIMFWSELC